MLSFGIVYVVLRPTRTETAVQQHLETIQESRAEEAGSTILKEENYSTNPELAAIVRQLPGAVETLDLLRQSGQPFSVSQVMGVSLAVGVLTAWISSYFLPATILALVAGIVAGTIPYIYLIVMRELRFRKCDELLPEAIDLMARGLRAGHALTAVLEMVSQEIAEPIGSEFRRLHEEHALGLPLREATMNLVSRLPRFLDGQLEHTLGLRRERHFPERERLGESCERALDLRLDGLEPQPQPLENRGGDSLTVTDQPEKDVFRADEIVAETTGFLTR